MQNFHCWLRAVFQLHQFVCYRRTGHHSCVYSVTNRYWMIMRLLLGLLRKKRYWLTILYTTLVKKITSAGIKVSYFLVVGFSFRDNYFRVIIGHQLLTFVCFSLISKPQIKSMFVCVYLMWKFLMCTLLVEGNPSTIQYFTGWSKDHVLCELLFWAMS